MKWLWLIWEVRGIEQMLLEIKRLNAHYGGAEVLKDISLTVGDGEIVALIGANGAGKTTTLRSISGLKKATSGEILFRGQPVVGLPPHHVAKLGIAHVPEGRGVIAPMTVWENLRMGAYLRRDKMEVGKDLEAMYRHFPILSTRRAQLAKSLSGGEQQMLAIARALMARPGLLLMDEPSMGLSPLMVEQVADIVADINKRGMSIILVEQNAGMALRLAHKAYVMEVGSITVEGTARELSGDERVRKAYLGG